MPDATIDTPEREVRDVPRDRPPVNNELPYHPFQQSEFPEGRGRCDSCGGGPDAPIHQKPIDSAEQLKRIADALESIATSLECLGDCVVSVDDGKSAHYSFRVAAEGDL
jgi:hypothetical protein